MSSATTIKTYILIRRGLAKEWESINPVLRLGEPGFATDTNILKIGDGTKSWTQLKSIGQNEYSLSPDGNSLTIKNGNELTLYGFDDAETGQIPVKGENGKLTWISINTQNLTGYIDDLSQKNPITIYGGSASESIIDGKGIFNSTICLRRDNDYNYAAIADTFIPAKGELCLVDTATDGLRVVCGDGIHKFSELEFAFSLLVRGYFYEGLFYKDSAHQEPVIGSIEKIYIDSISGKIYLYDVISGMFSSPYKIVNATDTEAGVMKLYSTLGQNIDGTMTQKAITDELNEKVELSLNEEEELLIFTF